MAENTYTPSVEDLIYEYALNPSRIDPKRRDAARRAIAAHDAELLEQVANETVAEADLLDERRPDLFSGLARERAQNAEQQRELRRSATRIRARAAEIRKEQDRG